MLSRLVITLLPRGKCLLISWLQSPSAMTLEPPKIKSDTGSTVSPSIYHKVNCYHFKKKIHTLYLYPHSPPNPAPTNHWFTSCVYRFTCFGLSYEWNHILWTSMTVFFHVAYFWGSSKLQHVSICHSFIWPNIFPIQRSNPGLPHYRWILYCLSHQGSRIYTYNAFYLSFHSLMDIWIVPTLGIL